MCIFKALSGLWRFVVQCGTALKGLFEWVSPGFLTPGGEGRFMFCPLPRGAVSSPRRVKTRRYVFFQSPFRAVAVCGSMRHSPERAF
jgi:hypothetical protein